MVLHHQHGHGSQWKAIESISKKLNVNHETLRLCMRCAEVDKDRRPGLTTDERERMCQLVREHAELCRANVILKAASAFFTHELDWRLPKWWRSSTTTGNGSGSSRSAERSPSTAPRSPRTPIGCHKKRPPSARVVRDAELVIEIQRVDDENLFVYGADKIWSQLNDEGISVARCTVERLMRTHGLCGARRGTAFTITTHHDDRQQRPADLVERKFLAPTPNRLWVADLTYVKTHSGWVCAAFIIDVALEMAVFNRQHAGHDLSQVTHHSDRGVQYLSNRYSECLAVNDIVASVGSKGDSDDCPSCWPAGPGLPHPCPTMGSVGRGGREPGRSLGPTNHTHD
jgi:putative transposase